MYPGHRGAAGGHRLVAQLLHQPRTGGIGDVGEDQQTLVMQLVQLIVEPVHRVSFLMKKLWGDQNASCSVSCTAAFSSLSRNALRGWPPA
ncbi:hypothetical protein D9M73_175390 [compost metagenome]